MENQDEVVLYGMWASGYCTRVELALKLKGIPYKYVEEDLANKSELLLQYNPVYKKVPVLVHNAKAIAESFIILEYIDECWNHEPKLLPKDPYERAKVRFWANYYDTKLVPSSYPIVMSKGEAQEKAIEAHSEIVAVFEEGIERDFPERSPTYFNGQSPDYLDIVVGSISCNYKACLEVVSASIDPVKHHRFFSWVNAMLDNTLIKDTIINHDRLVAMLKERMSRCL